MTDYTANIVHPVYEVNLTGNATYVGGGGGTYIEEPLTGTIDCSNKTFATTQNFITGSTWVFVNGLKQLLGTDYTEINNNSIVFVDAPSNVEFDDKLTIIYRTTENEN